MGKTLVYIALLGILGFGVYYLLFRDSKGLYQEKEANFTIADTANVGKIYLVENDGTSILVARGADNIWMLNNQYEAMPSQIKSLLSCLRMQEALMPVSDKDHDRVVKLLAGLATKVEVYDRKGAKMRSFFVAGQGANYHGSFMILENAKQPYLVEIRNYEGYLTPIYTTEFMQWRSRKVFDLSADDIATINLQYPSEPIHSFSIDNSSKPAQVAGANELKSDTKKLNQTRLKDYLGFFKNVNAESYINGTLGLDSIIANAPLRCILSVTDRKKNTTTLAVYWEGDKTINLASQTSTNPENRPENVERMYAVNRSTNDTLLIQARSFEKLFRQGFQFFEGVN